MSLSQDLTGQRLRDAVIQQIEDLQRAGVTQMARRRPRSQQVQVTEDDAEPGPLVSPVKQTSRRPPAPIGDKTLEVVAQDVATCTRCPELVANRTQTVFGVGNPTARLCFLGEAPGADEDRQGEPFVGRAGRLLTDIIQKGMGLEREDVYILNILKCRPPGNRNPAPDEAANCRGFLDRQLALIQPEFICCLGAVAAHNLLDTTTPIGRMRGNFYDYRGIRVMCTYHPAYLLRNPPAKKQTWEDIQLLMQEMGIRKTGGLE